MGEPAKLSASEAVRLMRAGMLRPADLMAACLARIAEREPVVRAFAWFDPDAARKAAATVRSAFRYSAEALRMPPSPCTGSTRIAAVSLVMALRISFILP